MPIDRTALEQTFSTAVARLLAFRTAAGHWEGRLSSSALSTATASFALAMAGGERHQPLVRRGLEWLVKNQNSDGGWGDTVLSRSNISTTLLAWSAMSLADASDSPVAGAVAKAEAWLVSQAGNLSPDALAGAVNRAYGDDRTFSAPILTMCVLAGRLGERPGAWRRVAPLPFELGALGHRWLRWLRMPVVSYALPALIAIGQVRHHFFPPRCPFTRLVRRLAAGATLRRLARIQPASGGFLEAAPLTSFVAMSLAAMGQQAHPAAAGGVEFLARTVRPDGSWPIDTNLATWVTTLAVNALAQCGPLEEFLSTTDRDPILGWLLGQQHTKVHPYTGAAPGGWAWTDLSGGVPDADDTAGAILALRHLAPDDNRVIDAAGCGVNWLLDIQNRDGGIPTFCRGWGRLPFDRSTADLTAHALRAWRAWRDVLPADPTTSAAGLLSRRVDKASAAALRSLARSQSSDGSWSPLWFGSEHALRMENRVYGTARVVEALAAPSAAEGGLCLDLLTKAVRWLISAANADGGWGGDGNRSGVEETSLAVGALARCRVPCFWRCLPEACDTRPKDMLLRKQCEEAWHPTNGTETPGHSPEEIESAIEKGTAWLIENTRKGAVARAAPIGLYFASLWYYEELYPLVFTVAALGQVRRLLSDTRH